MSTLGPALVPTFSPMNSIGASSISPSPITTVPSIGSLFKLAPHGIDRGLIGFLFRAAPAQPRRRDRGALGHAHDLERENALNGLVRRGRVRRHERNLRYD